MMTKLNKLLVAALVLQVGILIVTRLTGGESQVAKQTRLFPKLEVDEIRRVTVEDDEDNEIVLARQGEGWVLASAGGYPADTKKVDEALGKLPGLTAGPPVTDRPQHHRKLEVAKDKFQRRVTLELKGGEKHTFLLGSSPLIKRVHLRFADRDEVLLAGELSTWDLGTGATAWVDPSYFKVDKDRVVSLTLVNAGGTIALNVGPDGKWALATPGASGDVEGTEGKAGDDDAAGPRLKQSEVDSLLTSVTNITLDEPVGTKVDPAHGLDKPSASLTLVTRPGGSNKAKGGGDKDGQDADKGADKPRTHVLHVGAKQDDAYYARKRGSKFVVKIGSYAGEALVDKKLSDLLEESSDDGDDGDAAEEGTAGPAGAIP